MPWAVIESVRQWTGKRKGLLTGLVGVAVEETVNCVPGARLAVRILGEVAKHGIDRLADTRAAVPEVKEAGTTFPAEQLDQINAWLETLTTSYAGLLEKLETLVPDAGQQTDEELTALVKRTLQERADLAREFDGCARDVRQSTLSLARIEDKLDRHFHEVRQVALSLEEIKALFVDGPLAGDWAEFRKARPEAVQALVQADEHFLAGRRDQGAAVLLQLLQQRGVGGVTIGRHLGLVYLGQGQVAEAHRCLEQAGSASGKSLPAISRTLTSLHTAATRGGSVPVWRSLPRGFVVGRKYRIEAEVGRGGMASVYRAAGVARFEKGRVVAVKVPAPDLMTDASTRERFEREIEVSLRLSAGRCPHIVQTLGYEVFDDPHSGRELYGLVLEFIEGESLATYLALRQAENRRLPAEEIVRLLQPICEALDFAHQQSPAVFHRDVKPQNVLLTRQGAARLMDFGIAGVLDDCRATLTGRATSSARRCTCRPTRTSTPAATCTWRATCCWSC
jgi:hypothetical protein